MRNKNYILSTKVLTNQQKHIFENSDILLLEANFISVEYQTWESSNTVQNAIFTSQKAVLSALKNKVLVEKAYCVGAKTKALLEREKITVEIMKETSKDLAEWIIEKTSNIFFTFYSGNKRLDTLPNLLRNNQISFKEIRAYRTILTPHKIKEKLNGILFFSPSGVQSFLKENNPKGIAFCIGSTTADKANQHFERTIESSKITIEGVIELAIKYYNND